MEDDIEIEIEDSGETTDAAMVPADEQESGTATPGDLTFTEARLLGCMIEKEITTPEYYPMTLASLTAAANQRSNRSPVVEWDERTVEEGLDGLRRKRLAIMIKVAGARVPKYKHALGNLYGGLDRPMIAILCELLVRNVQTPGELRTRTERLCPFPSLEAVEECVLKLIRYGAGPLVVLLPPGGGRRVKAYAHLLCGPVDASSSSSAAPVAVVVPPSDDWKARIESELSALRAEVQSLKEALGIS